MARAPRRRTSAARGGRPRRTPPAIRPCAWSLQRVQSPMCRRSAVEPGAAGSGSTGCRGTRQRRLDGAVAEGAASPCRSAVDSLGRRDSVDRRGTGGAATTGPARRRPRRVRRRSAGARRGRGRSLTARPRLTASARRRGAGDGRGRPSRDSTRSRMRDATCAFVCKRHVLLAVGRHQRGGVGLDLEAGIRPGDVVGHDEVHCLARAFLAGPADDVVRLGREADEHGRQAIAAPRRRGRPGCRACAPGAGPVRLAAWRSSRSPAPPAGRVVRHRGRHDDGVGGRRVREHGLVHLRGGPHAHARRSLPAPARSSGPSTRMARAPRVAAAVGNRDPHAPARAIAQVAHRVEVFVGRARRDDDGAPGQRRARPQQRVGRLDNLAPAPPGGPSRSSRTPGTPRRARRSGRPRCRSVSRFCLRGRVRRACWCSSPARSARARAWPGRVDVRKSSARPCANRAMRCAVAGATSSSRASVASAMCSMSALAPGSHWSVTTRRRVMASKVTGPTNFVAECVMIATTSWPRFWRPRHTSTAL